MSKLPPRIISYLHRAIARDLDRGGSGYRDTREIAEHLSVSMATARRHLHALADLGAIDRYAADDCSLNRNCMQWHLADPEDGDREDLPEIAHNDNDMFAIAA